jgi:hypothetical protein
MMGKETPRGLIETHEARKPPSAEPALVGELKARRTLRQLKYQYLDDTHIKPGLEYCGRSPWPQQSCSRVRAGLDRTYRHSG